jgi:hypothetical protein
MLRSAMIRSHMSGCVDVHCMCRNRSLLYDSVTGEWSCLSIAPQNDPIFCKFFLKMLFEEGLAKFKEKRIIELSYLFAKWSLFHLYQKLLYEIKQYGCLFEREINLSDSYQMYHLRREIYDYLEMRNINNTYLKIEDVEKFDDSYQALKEKIIEIVKTHELFWKAMSETVVNRRDLLRIADDLAIRKENIEELYQKTLFYNSKSTGLLITMSMYSLKVVFDFKLARNIKKSIILESLNGRESTFEFPKEFRGDS